MIKADFKFISDISKYKLWTILYFYLNFIYDFKMTYLPSAKKKY